SVCKGLIRIDAAENGGRRWGRTVVAGTQDNGRRARSLQERRVSWVGDERQIPGAGALDAGDPADLDIAVTPDPAAQTFGEIPELQGEVRMVTSSTSRWPPDSADRAQTDVRRPETRFTMNRTSAITSRMWMKPAATFNASPSAQKMSSSTISVQSMSSP